jgi:RNA-binding protein NOB1
MWSAQGVASLLESFNDPDLKFEQAKKEPEFKVYEKGQEYSESVEVGPKLPNSSTNGLLSDNYVLDDEQTTATTEKLTGEIKRLVLDSGAFIMGANLTLYGPNCEYYSLEDVVAELKDENAKKAFANFPYPIVIKSPSPQAMQYITNVSTQTGDYHVLSFTDRRVLALAYQLEVESHGKRFIHDQISAPSSANQTVAVKPAPKKKKNKKTAAKNVENTTTETSAPPQTNINTWANLYTCDTFDLDSFMSSPIEEEKCENVEQIEHSTTPHALIQQPPTINPNGYLCYPSLYESYIPPVNEVSTISTSITKKTVTKSKFILPGFDDGEWVSPATVNELTEKTSTAVNLSNSHTATISSFEANQLLPTPIVSTHGITINNDQNGAHITGLDHIDCNKEGTVQYKQPHQHQAQPHQTSLSSVGCITTDYSMQNVMLQCGLRCLTLNGRAISTLRQYIMGCHACYTLSRDMSRGFCPSCGGFTMVRLIANVNNDGSAYYKWPMGRIENKRGTIFQVSKEQIIGKKGAGKIIVREDMMPKPKLKDLLIARGERVDDGVQNTLFDEAALFGFMRQYQQKSATYGFGKKNMNIAKRRK